MMTQILLCSLKNWEEDDLQGFTLQYLRLFAPNDGVYFEFYVIPDTPEVQV
jgi:hypothetical protein